MCKPEYQPAGREELKKVAFRSAKAAADVCGLCGNQGDYPALPSVTPIEVFARLQARLVWIIGDILPEVVILLEAANEVIERLLLPELTLFADCLVDLTRRVVQPRVALFRYRGNVAFRSESRGWGASATFAERKATLANAANRCTWVGMTIKSPMR